LTRIRKRPARKAKTIATTVRRGSVIMPAIPGTDVIQSACIGVAELIGDQCEGVVFVQQDQDVCWRVTVEVDRGGGDA
jgi:hypothetical protein